MSLRASFGDSGARPSSGPWGKLVGLAAALTALLAVVALASRGHDTPVGRGGTARGPSQAIADVFFTLLLCAMIATTIFVAYLHTWKRAERKRKADKPRAVFIGFAYFLLLSGLAVLAANRATVHHRPAVHFPNLAQTGEALQQKAGPRHPRVPRFEWPLAAGLAALGLAAIAVPAVRRRVGVQRYHRQQQIALELAGVVDESLEDLEREPDPRRAVIAAYARMERTLDAEGLPRRRAEAPFEYLARVLADLHTGARSAFALTELYERAEFSHHGVDTGMKREAISALTTLRNDLRAAAATP